MIGAKKSSATLALGHWSILRTFYSTSVTQTRLVFLQRNKARALLISLAYKARGVEKDTPTRTQLHRASLRLGNLQIPETNLLQARRHGSTTIDRHSWGSNCGDGVLQQQEGGPRLPGPEHLTLASDKKSCRSIWLELPVAFNRETTQLLPPDTVTQAHYGGFTR